ncbi:hypothetical protein F5Y07DRAFT_394154 [Xylaria sp. FL0933]|nr:hypothetical protein F5Y07DRAFT_394154 [Xylaria sp. FL0933]
MAHSVQTPSLSSPPADLRPAPLRIPHRKSVASFDDDPETAVIKDKGKARDTSTLSSYLRDTNRHSQLDVSSSLLERREPRCKLESLVSRFEILDTVDTVDPRVLPRPNNSYKTCSSTTPRATGSKRTLPHQDLVIHSPIESMSPTSAELSPIQTRPPSACGHKSMLPMRAQHTTKVPDVPERDGSGMNIVSARLVTVGNKGMDTNEGQTSARSPFAMSTIPVLKHSKTFTTSKETPPSRLPKSKLSRKANSSFLQSSTTSVSSSQAAARSSSKTASLRKEETPRRLRKDPKSPAGLGILLPQQRPSVADLRQSFEKYSQPAPGEKNKPDLKSKPSRHSMRKNQDMSPSTSSLHPGKLQETLSVAQSACSHLPLSGTAQTIHARPTGNETQLPSPQYPAKGSIKHDSSISLSPSIRSSLYGARQKKMNMSKPVSQTEGDKTPRESEKYTSLDALMDASGSVPFGAQQTDGALAATPKSQCEQPIADDTPVRRQAEIIEIPIVLSPGSRPTQGVGKVSQLRKFFERSSKILSSPLSLMTSHSAILEDDDEASSALMGDYSSSSWSESESLRSTHTLSRRISIVPSLTTEISVNDFFCDFVGSPSYEGTPVATPPSEPAIKGVFQRKHESPVKSRIQQFEHLSRDSLKAGTEQHGRHNDSDLQSTFENGNRPGGKRGVVGSWRPIHQKGVAIWRKISSSLSHSLESWKDCNSYHEKIDPIEGPSSNTGTDHPTAPAHNLRRGLGRFSPFGYSMHRIAHTSGHFMTPSHTTSSIQLGEKDTPNNVPRRELNASYSRSSLDTPPPLVIRKTIPVIARVSRGFRHAGNFGLDGHVPSKPVPEEEFRSSEVTRSGPSSPQGDPEALHKVMQKQSAAKRNRRREDRKHLRRDKRLKAIFKGKSKAEAVRHSADSTAPSEEANKKHERGKWKGKEKEVLRREPKQSEGQSSKGREGQDNEPNKKTESGFVIFESKDVKLRHPKPRRPGQVRKVANMYKEKGSSGASVNTKASSGATLKEGRQSFRQKASSALGLRGRRGEGSTG